MKMNWKAQWITADGNMGDICPVFEKNFHLEKRPVRAILSITARGVYEARLNGQRIGDYFLAPGWTSYETRLQYQQYDVTELLSEENTLEIMVGKGWYASPIPGWIEDLKAAHAANQTALLAQLEMDEIYVATGKDWSVRESRVRFSEIYDGETYDATAAGEAQPVKILALGYDNLIPQEGEKVCARETVYPKSIFRTPKGETVIDFGQEVTGGVRIHLNANAGDVVALSHGEVLDKDGNFYTENYRSARAKLRYICRDGEQSYFPKLTFFGFRYVRVDAFPGEPHLENFEAVAMCSELRRTGHIRCGVPEINRLMENVIWGQNGNFLDIPTDCPQRDERLGWTGDAQVFVKAASYNYDVQKFFTKWLADMAADQHDDGSIPHVVPDVGIGSGSAAWDDAAIICPWQIYMTYGDKKILAQQFDCMKKYLRFIETTTKEENLWIGGTHFGDWLGLDAPEGSYKGSSREDFIASAFYTNALRLTRKSAQVLGKEEETVCLAAKYERAIDAFRHKFPEYQTQTECVLALQFGLTEDPAATAELLAKRIHDCGNHLQTGFVGTPYLLHVLSEHGYTELAYDLLLRKEYPSWLYQVAKGATTVWEHWDGITRDGGFWSPDMNSFNHYAYGSVTDWIYEEAAGIHTVESAPGFARVRIAPKPDSRLGWLEASIDTRHGLVRSYWACEGDSVRYEVETPVPAQIEIEEKVYQVKKGRYLFLI